MRAQFELGIIAVIAIMAIMGIYQSNVAKHLFVADTIEKDVRLNDAIELQKQKIGMEGAAFSALVGEGICDIPEWNFDQSYKDFYIVEREQDKPDYFGHNENWCNMYCDDWCDDQPDWCDEDARGMLQATQCEDEFSLGTHCSSNTDEPESWIIQHFDWHDGSGSSRIIEDAGEATISYWFEYTADAGVGLNDNLIVKCFNYNSKWWEIIESHILTTQGEWSITRDIPPGCIDYFNQVGDTYYYEELRVMVEFNDQWNQINYDGMGVEFKTKESVFEEGTPVTDSVEDYSGFGVYIADLENCENAYPEDGEEDTFCYCRQTEPYGDWYTCKLGMDFDWTTRNDILTEDAYPEIKFKYSLSPEGTPQSQTSVYCLKVGGDKEEDGDWSQVDVSFDYSGGGIETGSVTGVPGECIDPGELLKLRFDQWIRNTGGEQTTMEFYGAKARYKRGVRYAQGQWGDWEAGTPIDIGNEVNMVDIGNCEDAYGLDTHCHTTDTHSEFEVEFELATTEIEAESAEITHSYIASGSPYGFIFSIYCKDVGSGGWNYISSIISSDGQNMTSAKEIPDTCIGQDHTIRFKFETSQHEGTIDIYGIKVGYTAEYYHWPIFETLIDALDYAIDDLEVNLGGAYSAAESRLELAREGLLVRLGPDTVMLEDEGGNAEVAGSMALYFRCDIGVRAVEIYEGTSWGDWFMGTVNLRSGVVLGESGLDPEPCEFMYSTNEGGVWTTFGPGDGVYYDGEGGYCKYDGFSEALGETFLVKFRVKTDKGNYYESEERFLGVDADPPVAQVLYPAVNFEANEGFGVYVRDVDSGSGVKDCWYKVYYNGDDGGAIRTRRDCDRRPQPGEYKGEPSFEVLVGDGDWNDCRFTVGTPNTCEVEVWCEDYAGFEAIHDSRTFIITEPEPLVPTVGQPHIVDAVEKEWAHGTVSFQSYVVPHPDGGELGDHCKLYVNGKHRETNERLSYMDRCEFSLNVDAEGFTQGEKFTVDITANDPLNHWGKGSSEFGYDDLAPAAELLWPADGSSHTLGGFEFDLRVEDADSGIDEYEYIIYKKVGEDWFFSRAGNFECASGCGEPIELTATVETADCNQEGTETCGIAVVAEDGTGRMPNYVSYDPDDPPYKFSMDQGLPGILTPEISGGYFRERYDGTLWTQGIVSFESEVLDGGGGLGGNCQLYLNRELEDEYLSGDPSTCEFSGIYLDGMGFELGESFKAEILADNAAGTFGGESKLVGFEVAEFYYDNAEPVVGLLEPSAGDEQIAAFTARFGIEDGASGINEYWYKVYYKKDNGDWSATETGTLVTCDSGCTEEKEVVVDVDGNMCREEGVDRCGINIMGVDYAGNVIQYDDDDPTFKFSIAVDDAVVVDPPGWSGCISSGCRGWRDDYTEWMRGTAKFKSTISNNLYTGLSTCKIYVNGVEHPELEKQVENSGGDYWCEFEVNLDTINGGGELDPGMFTLKIGGEDRRGEFFRGRTSVFYYDNEAAVVDISPDSGSQRSSFDILVTAQDVASGVDDYAYAIFKYISGGWELSRDGPEPYYTCEADEGCTEEETFQIGISGEDCDEEGTDTCKVEVFVADILAHNTYENIFSIGDPPKISIVSIAGEAYEPAEIGDSTPDIELELDEAGDCRMSPEDESYADMSDNIGCAEDGTLVTCSIASPLSDGTHHYYVACEDALGNSHTFSENRDITFEIETSAPIFTAGPWIEALAGGVTFFEDDTGTTYFKGGLSVKADVEENGNGLDEDSCEFSANGGGTWPYSASYHADGYCWYGSEGAPYSPGADFTAKFKMDDLSGNTGVSGSEPYVYDGTAPTIGIVGLPVAGAWQKEDFSIQVSESDAGSGLKWAGMGEGEGCEYMFYRVEGGGSETLIEEGTRVCGNTNGVPALPVGSGADKCSEQGEDTCKVVVVAYDNVDNAASSQRYYSIDYTAPTVSITGPAAGSAIGPGDFVTTYDNDGESGIEVGSCRYRILQRETVSDPWVQSKPLAGRTCGGAISMPSDLYDSYCTFDGTNTCRIEIDAMNLAGILGSGSRDFSISSDVSAPVITLGNIAGDSAAPYAINENRPLVRVTLNEPGECRMSESDETYAEMDNNIHCNDGDPTSVVDCQLSYALTPGPGIGGTNMGLYVACKDGEGNENSETNNLDIDFLLDVYVPDPHTYNPADGATVTSDPFTFTFSTSEPAKCRAAYPTDQSYGDMADDVDCTGASFGTSHSCDMSGLGEDGGKTIHISCADDTDSVANEDTTGTNEDITYTLSQGSAPAFDAPEFYAGNYYGDWFKLTAGEPTVSVRAEVTDQGGGIKESTCQYSTDGGNNWDTGSYLAPYCRSVDYNPGTSNFDMQFGIEDDYGNPSTSSEKAFKYDGTAPGSSITAPAGGTWYKSGDVITVQVSETDGQSGIDTTPGRCKYDLKDGAIWIKTDTDRTCTYGVDINVGVGGSPCTVQGQFQCRVKITAFDRVGNSAFSERVFSVDTTNPSSAVGAPDTDPYVGPATAIPVTDSDSHSGIVAGTCEYQILKGPAGSRSVSLPWTTRPGGCNANVFVEGYCDVVGADTCEVQTRVQDAAGNTGTGSRVFSISNTGPSLSNPAIYSGSNYEGTCFKGSVGFKSVVTKTGADIDTDTCEFSGNGGGNWNSATWDGTDSCTYAYSLGGSPEVVFRAQDKTGLTGTSAAVSFTYDGQGPTSAIQSPLPPTPYSDGMSITVADSDNGCAGLLSCKYEIIEVGGGSPQSRDRTANCNGAFTPASGVCTTPGSDCQIDVYAFDKFGMIGTIDSKVYPIPAAGDSTPPSVVLGSYRDPVPLSGPPPFFCDEGIRESFQFTFDTDEPARCKADDEALFYDAMPGAFCEVGFSSTHTCIIDSSVLVPPPPSPPPWACGLRTFYISCEDELGNRDDEAGEIDAVDYEFQPP